MWQVFIERMRQPTDPQRLQPDSPWPSQRSEKKPVAAEKHVLDARKSRDLKRNAGLKRPDMSRMHPQSFSRLKIADHEFAGKFQPRGPLPAQFLQKKAVAAENSRAQRLLEGDGDLNLRCPAQKAVAMNQVLVSRRDFNRNNVSRQLGRKRDFAGNPGGAILGHENRPAPGHPLNHSE